ncbi:hypothetical protein V8J36_16990 [Frigidibacter sp. MR17.14]|uniref:hypothetical protein n=1 Tax=Frigidibacter sp. MR17.14 TaxID=3126509 RepID=UPI003012DE81
MIRCLRPIARTLGFAGLLGAPALSLAGPVAAPVTIAQPAGVACEVTLAHWYVLRFAAEDGQVALPLRFDAATQTVSILNTRGVEMAVEGLLCGPEPRLHAEGRRLDFRALAMRAAAG